MKIDIVPLNGLWNQPEDLDAVVVIDVLRSFTTAAVGFDRGARAIYLASGPAAAFALWRQRPHASLVGALGGGRTVPGFDFGNSPSALGQATLTGQDLILSTAAGVRGVLRFAHVPLVFGASLCVASATAKALLQVQPRRVALVVTGEWVNRDGDEDLACADYLRALLLNEPIDRAAIVSRVRHSDFGRSFGAPETPHLPQADLDYCTACDRFDFALRLHRETASGHLRLLPQSMPNPGIE